MNDNKLPITSYFVPEGLKGLDLNARISIIMDHIRTHYHNKNIDQVRAKWDPSSDQYDHEKRIREVEGGAYLKYLSSNEDEQARASLSRMLIGIYKMKGTRRALDMILSILGIQGRVTSYSQIRTEIDADTAQGRIWEATNYLDLKPCQILVTITLDTKSSLGVVREKLLLDLVNTFLWTCANLGAFLIIRYISDLTMSADCEGSGDSGDLSLFRRELDPDVGDYLVFEDTRQGESGVNCMYDIIKVKEQCLIYGSQLAYYGFMEQKYGCVGGVYE